MFQSGEVAKTVRAYLEALPPLEVTDKCPPPPVDLAALAEAAARGETLDRLAAGNEITETKPRLAAYLRAVAAHHRAEAAERERIAALDAEVVQAVRDWRRGTSISVLMDALARRFGGTP